MAKDQITIFAVGNGDAIFIEARGKRILTDVNHRAACEDDDEMPDIAGPIREACVDDHLHLFVLTHPDQDHLRGFTDLFHVGPPGSHEPNPKEGEPKIIVDEMWCSPYAADCAYETDCSRPVLEEIKRRKALVGKPEATIAGNRLRILDTSKTKGERFADGIAWELLAPTLQEAKIPKAKEGEPQPSSNPSSLVIRWAITMEDKDNYVLLGGDSPVEVWERIWADNKERCGRLAWHILVSPHHTSRYALGRKDEKGVFRFSDDAISALSQQQGLGRVVSSSKKIVQNDDDPPSWAAKQKYLEILAAGKAVDEAVKRRFLCTGEYDDGKPGHVPFRFTRSGPAEGRGGSKSGPVVTAASRGGGYG